MISLSMNGEQSSLDYIRAMNIYAKVIIRDRRGVCWSCSSGAFKDKLTYTYYIQTREQPSINSVLPKVYTNAILTSMQYKASIKVYLLQNNSLISFSSLHSLCS